MLKSVAEKSIKISSVYILFLVVGCSSYRQNIMFKPGDGFTGNAIQQAQLSADRQYVVQPNDKLKLDVFSNKGERIIDPNGELRKSLGATSNADVTEEPFLYVVAPDGTLKAPMIGVVKIQGLTIREAELLLQKEYDQFYKECYVNLSFQNKRFMVLGALGGQVIPLENDNIKIVEALALAKGVNNDGKAQAIRLLRGDEVYLIDFSTVAGFRKSNMVVQPGDVIYVEPVRRPFLEGIRDFAAVGGFLVSLGTLVIVILNSSQ